MLVLLLNICSWSLLHIVCVLKLDVELEPIYLMCILTEIIISASVRRFSFILNHIHMNASESSDVRCLFLSATLFLGSMYYIVSVKWPEESRFRVTNIEISASNTYRDAHINVYSYTCQIHIFQKSEEGTHQNDCVRTILVSVCEVSCVLDRKTDERTNG